jgi:hypothetical protein
MEQTAGMNETEEQVPNPNAAILADLAAKAERHAALHDRIFNGPEPAPAHEREQPIETQEDE